MSLKAANTSFHYLKLLNKGEFLNASHYIELPTKEHFKINVENCIVAYYDYKATDPLSKRTFKLFRHYEKFTEKNIENDLAELNKVNVILIFINIRLDACVNLLNILNKKYLKV